MSAYKKQFLFLFVAISFFMFGCVPIQTVDNEDTAEIGQPSVQCGSNGQLVIVFPASPYVIQGLTYRGTGYDPENPPYITLIVEGRIYSVASVTPNTIVYHISAPPEERNAWLTLSSTRNYIPGQGSFHVTLPACETRKTSDETENDSAYVPPVVDPPITEPPPTEPPNPDGIPVVYNSTCLQGKNLMVAFEFPEPITGQYEAIIDGQVYQYAPVSDYPNRAYFFGSPPENQGPASVSLSTFPDGIVVFEQQDYAFPACGVQKQKKDDDHYVPPSY
jgi:hypothetical protein